MLFANVKKVSDYLYAYSKKLEKPTKLWEEGRINYLFETLEWLNHYDEFYALIDLKTQTIPWCFGFENHMGYADSEIKNQNIAVLEDMNHPFMKGIDTLFSTSLLKINTSSPSKKWNVLKTRYIINIPIRKKNGTFILVKRMTFPIQLDTKGIPFSFLNVYTIVSSYRGQALRPRFFEGVKNDASTINRLFEVASEFASSISSNFTKKQFEYIDAFIDSFSKIGNKAIDYKHDIGKKLNIDRDTSRVNEHNIRGIMCKMFKYPSAYESHDESDLKNFLSCLPDFDSFKDGVHYLHKSGILTVLKNIYENQKLEKVSVKNF